MFKVSNQTPTNSQSPSALNSGFPFFRCGSLRFGPKRLNGTDFESSFTGESPGYWVKCEKTDIKRTTLGCDRGIRFGWPKSWIQGHLSGAMIECHDCCNQSCSIVPPAQDHKEEMCTSWSGIWSFFHDAWVHFSASYWSFSSFSSENDYFSTWQSASKSTSRPKYDHECRSIGCLKGCMAVDGAGYGWLLWLSSWWLSTRRFCAWILAVFIKKISVESDFVEFSFQLFRPIDIESWRVGKCIDVLQVLKVYIYELL